MGRARRGQRGFLETGEGAAEGRVQAGALGVLDPEGGRSSFDTLRTNGAEGHRASGGPCNGQPHAEEPDEAASDSGRHALSLATAPTGVKENE